MTKLGMLTLAGVLAATPAFAAQFYIVQDSNTKKCTIVSEKPTTTTTTTIMGDGTTYTTQEEANTALTKVCTK